nr:FHA domain-containing protein [Oscillatoria sp. FACHB-1406]
MHPIRLTPIQSWEFSGQSLVRVGRAPDNDVILYSSVVSRYHIELQRYSGEWELVSLGANGTYVEGKLIQQISALNNTTLHLARSGPKILLRLGAIDPNTAGIRTISPSRTESALHSC